MIGSRALRWALFAASLLFAGLGLFFVCAPEQAAGLFGIPTALPDGHGHVRAVGLRDIALAGYLALLTLFASARAVLVVLLVTLIIPVGDLVLVAGATGGEARQMVLHLASAMLFAGLATWVWTSMRSRQGTGNE